MKKTFALLFLAGSLTVLSGCNHYCDDCDDRPVGACRSNYSAITNCTEGVPAPAPIATAPVKAPVKPAIVAPEIKPVAKPAPREIQPAPIALRPAANVIARESRTREEFSYENASSF